MNTYKPVFIGRQEAIDLFYSLRSLREQKNALYIESGGGFGKTWLLRKYVEECQKQRRPWYTGTENSDDPQEAIIDFYYLENRTVAGLRRSIARRLGEKYFSAFQALDDERTSLEQKGSKGEEDKTRLAALEQRTEAVFFEELRGALRKIRNYTVLLFDTFEVVHNHRVGRWFLETFLPHPVTKGYLIIFAGRPRGIVRKRLPLNAHFYELKPFSRQEAEEYFNKKHEIDAASPEAAVITVCKGKPLLLDLSVEYMRQGRGKVEDLLDLTEEEVERIFVGDFLNAKSPLDDVLHEMAYLKRRYNQEIFNYLRKKYQDEMDFASIAKELERHPFVKIRLKEGLYSLHDEFQRMIGQHAGGWKDRSKELYGDVVEAWYPRALDSASPGPEKDMLRAEQLAYLLEYDFEAGLARYQTYFEEIKQHGWFDFNDMLWGEMAGYLYGEIEQQEKEGKVEPALLRTTHHLTLQQADWLFDHARHGSAAFWFEQTLEARFVAVRSQKEYAHEQVRLGHCYMRLGQVDDAGRLWENALEGAKQEGQVGTHGLFAYNLGHVRVRQGFWDQALQLYEEAIESARQSGDVKLLAEALFVIARLRARQGKIEEAIQDLVRSRRLIEQIYREPHVRKAQAFVYAADLYRYDEDVTQATGYYRAALQVLDKLKAWYDWRVQASAGLGAACNLSGVQKRNQWGDLKGDLEDQEQAFNYFLDSLNTVRQHEGNAHLMLVLDRLADVYLEFAALEDLVKKSDSQISLEGLKKKMDGLELVEEQRWLDVVREAGKPFQQLDTLGKAQRLFEVASLHSEDRGEPHLMLDSLVGAASTAQLRGREADLEYYATLARTLGELDDPHQEKLFFAVLDMLRAHLKFEADPQSAVEEYIQAGRVLADGGSFGMLLIRTQFPRIQERLLLQPRLTAKDLCKSLADAWSDIPQLLAFVREVEDLLLASKDE